MVWSLYKGVAAGRLPTWALSCLVFLQGTLQKFVDDLFQVILSTSRPVPLAVKYFFDLLDEQAQQHGISDQDTIHIWKTNRCGRSRAQDRREGLLAPQHSYRPPSPRLAACR